MIDKDKINSDTLSDALFKAKNLKEQFAVFDSVCPTDIRQYVLNKIDHYDCPIWANIFMTEHFNGLLKYYSKYIEQTNRNQTIFLSINDSMKASPDWIPKDSIKTLLINNIFHVHYSNFKYILDNNMLEDKEQVFLEILSNIKTSFKNFMEEYSNTCLSISTKTISEVCNLYYQSTNNMKAIRKVVYSIIENDMFSLRDDEYCFGVDELTGIFREVFLKKYFNDKIPQKTINNSFSVIKVIIDNDEFKEYKNKIYNIIRGNDLLIYAITKKYFTPEDLISFIGNEDLKSETEKFYLEQKIVDNNYNKKIKM